MDTNNPSIYCIICRHKDTLYEIKEVNFCVGGASEVPKFGKFIDPIFVLYPVYLPLNYNLFDIPYSCVWYPYTSTMNILPS